MPHSGLNTAWLGIENLPQTCSPAIIPNATLVACPLGAHSSVAEQSAHNRSVIASIPAGPTSILLPNIMLSELQPTTNSYAP